MDRHGGSKINIYVFNIGDGTLLVAADDINQAMDSVYNSDVELEDFTFGDYMVLPSPHWTGIPADAIEWGLV